MYYSDKSTNLPFLDIFLQGFSAELLVLRTTVVHVPMALTAQPTLVSLPRTIVPEVSTARREVHGLNRVLLGSLQIRHQPANVRFVHPDISVCRYRGVVPRMIRKVTKSVQRASIVRKELVQTFVLAKQVQVFLTAIHV